MLSPLRPELPRAGSGFKLYFLTPTSQSLPPPPHFQMATGNFLMFYSLKGPSTDLFWHSPIHQFTPHDTSMLQVC